jgi:hypothetical protein
LEYSKFGPLQKCPYQKSILVWIFRLGQMALGTLGLIYLNVWIAVSYLLFSIVFTFWAWPVKHCKYCYYNVTTTDQKNGKTVIKLLPVEEWKELYLKKHVNRGKKLFPPLGLMLWLLPIVLIGVSFFVNFSIIALLSLIGFIVMLAVMLLYVRWKVCPTCAFMEECHEAF